MEIANEIEAVEQISESMSVILRFAFVWKDRPLSKSLQLFIAREKQ